MKVAVGAAVAHYTAAILWGNGRLSCKSLYPAASFVRGIGRIKPTERARKRILSDSELQSVWNTAEER